MVWTQEYQLFVYENPHLTLKMTASQVVKTSVNNNSLSELLTRTITSLDKQKNASYVAIWELCRNYLITCSWVRLHFEKIYFCFQAER